MIGYTYRSKKGSSNYLRGYMKWLPTVGEMGLDDPAVAAGRVSPCSYAVFGVISSLYTTTVSLPKEELCLNIKEAPNGLLVTISNSEWKPYLTFRSILKSLH